MSSINYDLINELFCILYNIYMRCAAVNRPLKCLRHAGVEQ